MKYKLDEEFTKEDLIGKGCCYTRDKLANKVFKRHKTVTLWDVYDLDIPEGDKHWFFRLLVLPNFQSLWIDILNESTPNQPDACLYYGTIYSVKEGLFEQWIMYIMLLNEINKGK